VYPSLDPETALRAVGALGHTILTVGHFVAERLQTR